MSNTKKILIAFSLTALCVLGTLTALIMRGSVPYDYSDVKAQDEQATAESADAAEAQEKDWQESWEVSDAVTIDSTTLEFHRHLHIPE